MPDSDPEVPKPTRQSSAGYSAGTNQGTTEEMKERIDNTTFSMGDNPMVSNLADRAASARPAVKASAAEQGAANPLVEALEGFRPVFQQREVTRHFADLEDLYGILTHQDENKEWNGSCTSKIMKIKKEIEDFKEKNNADHRKPPNLRKLKDVYETCTKCYEDLYTAIANIMNSDETCKFEEISKVCKLISIEVPNTCFQSATQIKPLFDHAVIAIGFLQKYLSTYEGKSPDGMVEVQFGKLKKLPRLMEKMLSRSIGCAGIMDVVRAMIVCSSNATICKVLKQLAADENFIIERVKDGYSTYRPGQWIDVKLIVSLKLDHNQHKCEIQIVHKKMVTARKDMGGHTAYSKYRSLAETIESLSNEEQGVAEFADFLVKFKEIVAQNNSKRIKALAEAFDNELMKNFELNAKLGSSIGKLEARLPDLISARKFGDCQIVQTQIDKLKEEREELKETGGGPDPLSASFGGPLNPPVKFLPRGELESDLTYLDQYPSIPLTEYEADGNFWHINKNFPNLRAIHKDPWIFLAPNLLTVEECRALVDDTGTKLVRSKVAVRGDGGASKNTEMVEREGRTSWEVRVPHDETRDIQAALGKLLDMPVANMEPLKVVRYKEKEVFNDHHDCNDGGHPEGTKPCPTPYCNRVVSCFTYLNCCESGGETLFLNYNLRIKPRTGMAVIHFPAHLPSATYKGPDDPLSLKVGTKVKIGTDHGVVQSLPGTGLFSRLLQPKTALVKMDQGQDSMFAIPLDQEQQRKMDVQVLSHMRGERDSRLLHAGLPPSKGSEKYIATQWGWAGPFDYTKHPTMCDSVKSLKNNAAQ
jgi:hypothetical protein